MPVNMGIKGKESCPRSLECALLRREFCLPGSYACGPCLSQFVEDGDGQCVPKARPAGGRPSAPNLEEEVDLVAEVLSKQDNAQQDGTPAPVGKHPRIGAPKSEPSPKGQAGRPLATPSLRPEAIQRTPVEKPLSSNDALILGMIVVCTAAGIAALVVAAVCWCRNKEEAKVPESASSDEENEDGDFTVYECPGLAPTGEMEVKNPLFDDASLRSPPTKLHP
ncbi:neural proliferation differentiation and control protein 1-like [Zootoca vivipara]|uniref:neural proliferation differentiation and control protein 1-like n=1 Tax=Zootoca vivipara TaxID=8524 RepID=UPI00293B88B8|nr:neural proliferation differentiation and control protein 1-like [Zootoca vivipara]